MEARQLYDNINFVLLGMELKWCVKKGCYDWKAEFSRITDGILQAAPRASSEKE